MKRHLIANLWLLTLTLLICSVAYPFALWAIGQTVFPNRAGGSLVDVDGQAVGSRLIAQPFTDDAYFHPRPSAASYNGAASGASNWGASNPLLRERVARQLGQVVKYRGGPKKGQRVGPDVEAWSAAHPEIRCVAFEAWRRAHPDADLEPVPADMVLASGSGLDPHITLKNAHYQLDRVAAAWAEKLKVDRERVAQAIRELLQEKKAAPLGGLAGVELVNVLEVNLALPERVRLAQTR